VLSPSVAPAALYSGFYHVRAAAGLLCDRAGEAAVSIDDRDAIDVLLLEESG
jgi:hypothetical protein